MAEYNLPHNDDIEKTVLGIMLMDPVKCLDALLSLSEDDFYINNTSHRAIFRAIQTVSGTQTPVDIHTVANELNKHNILDSIGGIDYLLSLTDNVTGTSNLKYYTDMLNDYSNLRKLLNTIDGIQKDVNKQKVEDYSKFVGECEAKIMEITQKRRISGFVNAGEVAKQVGNQISLINSENASSFSGITTGYKYVDKVLKGLQKSSLIILAARPAVGKSALGLNIAFNASKATNRPVAFFSCEMAAQELMKRLFANRSTVPLEKISSGYLTKDDRLKLAEAQEEISNVNLYFDDTSNIPLEDLVSKAKKLKNDLGDLALIVVDYIGLVKVRLKTDNTVMEISRVTQTLHALARELEIPVLALAQVNRRVEDRENAKPELSNLKDSGSIEQDADQVMFLYNPNMAIQNKKKKEQQAAQQNNNSNDGDDDIPSGYVENTNPNNGELVQLLVKKNRSGQLKDCYLLFFKDYQRFDSPSPEAIEEFRKYYKD